MFWIFYILRSIDSFKYTISTLNPESVTGGNQFKTFRITKLFQLKNRILLHFTFTNNHFTNVPHLINQQLEFVIICKECCFLLFEFQFSSRPEQLRWLCLERWLSGLLRRTTKKWVPPCRRTWAGRIAAAGVADWSCPSDGHLLAMEKTRTVAV